MQFVSSRPRESSETFLLGRQQSRLESVCDIRRDCCHQFVSERDFKRDAQRVCQAERSLMSPLAWTKRAV